MPATLLVVDDDVSIQRLVAYTLRPLQVEVIGAVDSTRAFAMIAQHTPDLMLIDLNLPGIDGFTLMRQIREMPACATVPIIVFTARNHPDDVERARQLGVNGFLYKPFSTQELRQIVSDHLSPADA
jgi:chemosensory pili system protein ChpA (sensor histidine kinase/response regulator)